MDNMNKQKPIATDISQWNNCTEIIYKCPRCGQEFRTLGSYELFCHHCGIEFVKKMQRMKKRKKWKKQTVEVNRSRF